MKLIALIATIFGIVSLAPGDELTGKWVSPPSAKGTITTVIFKEDRSFEGFQNKKAFFTGNYTLSQGVFHFTDNGCTGVEGVYKLLFSHNNDSLRFQLISDSCAGRNVGMPRLTLGKSK